MSTRAARARTYLPPARSLRRRFAAVRVPAPLVSQPALAVAVALVVLLCSFISRGGSEVERTTWTEVGLIALGSGLAALALLLPRAYGAPVRLRGAGVVLAFGLLAVFTTLSITWSLTPGDSWLEANRTTAYLATLVAGLALGRLVPARWAAMTHGMALAATVLCGWALLTKVMPGVLAPNEPFARLRPPFEYWNSVGVAAALGLAPMLWLAARRSGHAAVNALAWPGLGILIVCLMLSYSRGALLVAGLGLAVWFAVVPLRLRAVTALGVVLVLTVPILAWAFAQDGLTVDQPPLVLREDTGFELGALLLLLLVALLVCGLVIGFLSSVHPPSEARRRRASRILIGTLAVVPAVGILMLANAPGGIGGQLSSAWQQAVDPEAKTPPNTPGRFTETSSVRSRYWREALDIHRQAPWLGSGAGAYGTLRLRYREDQRTVRHAHGYVVQTLADLGWIGLGLSLLATVAWFAAVARVVGLRRRDRGLPWDAERVGMATLAVVSLIFGLHSTIDWTWFVPGNVVPALLCAGWVVSRPPLRERLIAEPAPPPRRTSALHIAAAALVLLTGVTAAWAALQPVRALHAENAAYERVDQGALPQAASIAQIAHERNPLAVDPLYDIAAVAQARGDLDAAERALQQAVALEPASYEPRRRLGVFVLSVRNDPRAALRSFRAAYYLNPRSARAISDLLTAARLVSDG